MSKYIIDIPNGITKNYWCGFCQDKCDGSPRVEDCSGWILSQAQEVVEVPASKEALLIWLGNSELKIFAAKDEKK